jgi:hAT family C-terminal dimerisation region
LRYPTLFRLAMDILPIQGSSVPCERVFSSAKETMTDRRNKISPELMEALQLLKFSLRQGHFLDFSAGTSWDAELAATEAAHYATMPDDLDSFIAALNRHI